GSRDETSIVGDEYRLTGVVARLACAEGLDGTVIKPDLNGAAVVGPAKYLAAPVQRQIDVAAEFGMLADAKPGATGAVGRTEIDLIARRGAGGLDRLVGERIGALIDAPVRGGKGRRIRLGHRSFSRRLDHRHVQRCCIGSR